MLLELLSCLLIIYAYCYVFLIRAFILTIHLLHFLIIVVIIIEVVYSYYDAFFTSFIIVGSSSHIIVAN